MTGKPSVLFVCVHNAGRSQMAAGWLRHLARDTVEVRSAGSEPADRINPVAVRTVRRLAAHRPAGQPVEVVRVVRDDIRARVEKLIADLIRTGLVRRG